MKQWVENCSIQVKLRFFAILIVVTVLLLSSWVVISYERASYRGSEHKRLNEIADLVAADSTSFISLNDQGVAKSYIGSLKVVPEILVAELIDLQGTSFAKYLRSSQKHIGANSDNVDDEYAEDWQSHSIVVTRDIDLHGTKWGTLVLTGHLGGSHDSVSMLIIILLGVGVVTVILARLFSNAFSSILVAPLRQLVSLMKEVTNNRRYSLRFNVASLDEVGELSNGFNSMLSFIEQNDEELKAHKANLEQTVARRTAELNKSVHELKNANEQADKASHAKSLFLANMSHEIRTPLNGINSLATLLKYSELNEEQQEDIVSIELCVNSLRGIIDNILDFSKIEVGKLVIDKTSFSIKEMFADLFGLLSIEAKEKGLELRLTISEELPNNVIGDGTRVRQVLANLVGNSLKFTPEGGHVDVSADLDSVEQGELTVHFSIKDDGVGIDGNNQQAVFQPFEQEDASTTRRHGGAGLGLSICAKLVEMMDGCMWLESEQDAGSTFHFLLPFEAISTRSVISKKTSPIEIPEVLEPECKCRILLVEDNLVNQRTISRVLMLNGYDLLIANDGLDALTILHKGDSVFDVILMDLQMPNMGGIEATKKIRELEDKRISSIPIIAVTAYAIQGIKEECLDAGMNDYISKPIKYDVLFASINNLVKPKSTDTVVSV